MAKIVRTLRNHWKKSVFGAGVLSYGIHYGLNEIEVGKTMTVLCETAVKYGDISASFEKPKKITVILNPAANKRKAKKNFEKFCAPLLHLAGIYISVIETEMEGHGRDVLNKLDPQTDAIIIAGGDGTLSEVITGLMRHKGELCSIPVGVLPLGRTNTLAKRLFGPESCSTYKGMASAAMTVVKGNTKPIDAIRIEVIQDNEEPPKPPVYGIGGINWGLWREIKKRGDAFWYLGPLSKYAPLIFHGDALNHEVKAHVRYTKPCAGCSQCFKQRPDLAPPAPSGPGTSRWWNFLSLKNRRLQNQGVPAIDYSSIENTECSVVEEVAIKTSDLTVATSNDPSVDMKTAAPHVLLSLAPKIKYQGELLFEGIKAVTNKKRISEKIEAKQLEIRPEIKNTEENEENLSIDNEDYEVRPIRVTVLPNAVKVFCP